MMPVLAQSRFLARLTSLTILDQLPVEFHFWIFQLFIQLKYFSNIYTLLEAVCLPKNILGPRTPSSRNKHFVL